MLKFQEFAGNSVVPWPAVPSAILGVSCPPIPNRVSPVLAARGTGARQDSQKYVNIQPERDVVARVDKHTGVVQQILCRTLNGTAYHTFGKCGQLTLGKIRWGCQEAATKIWKKLKNCVF